MCVHVYGNGYLPDYRVTLQPIRFPDPQNGQPGSNDRIFAHCECDHFAYNGKYAIGCKHICQLGMCWRVVS